MKYSLKIWQFCHKNTNTDIILHFTMAGRESGLGMITFKATRILGEFLAFEEGFRPNMKKTYI